MTRVVSRVQACAAPLLALVTCCSSSGGPAAEPSESLPLTAAPQPGPCGGADRQVAAEPFRWCLSNDDCVAVPVVGCCHNGWKTSVNRDEEDAYEHSFVCPQERPLCPLYLVVDRRVPECDAATHLCELSPVQCATTAPRPP